MSTSISGAPLPRTRKKKGPGNNVITSSDGKRNMRKATALLNRQKGIGI